MYSNFMTFFFFFLILFIYLFFVLRVITGINLSTHSMQEYIPSPYHANILLQGYTFISKHWYAFK